MRKEKTTPQEIYARARRFFGCDKDDQFERFLGAVVDHKHFDAPQRLAEHKAFFTDEMVLRQHERADWQYADRRLMIWAAAMFYTMRKKGVPLFAHSVWRSRHEQDKLLAAGRSMARYPRAPHCQGKAIDLVHSRYAWELTPREWAFLGKVGKDLAVKLNIPMEWGGDWADFYDPAHWQLADWKADIRQLPFQEPRRFTPAGLRKHVMGR